MGIGISSNFSLVLLLIIMFTFVVSCTTLTRRKYFYVFLITLLLSVLASLYNPITAYENGNYTDLYRFYQTINSIKGYPFNNDVLIFQEYNNIIVMKVLLFVISRIGINALLPFISSFVFYGVSGIFIIKICEKYNVSSKIMGLSFFLFICLFNYKMVISNIRCPVGEAIFVLTLYYDFLKEKKSKLYLLGYLICCGIHPIFILFIILRLMLLIKNKVIEKIYYAIILLYSLFINVFFELIAKLTNIELFGYIYMKMNYYTNLWNGKTNELLIILTGILQIGVLIYLLFILRNILDKKSSEFKFYKLSIIYTILSISSYGNFVIFQRCTWLLIFFIIYWYVYIKSLKSKNNRFKVAIYDIVILFLIAFSLISYFFTYQYNVLTF